MTISTFLKHFSFTTVKICHIEEMFYVIEIHTAEQHSQSRNFKTGET